jgi:hypothetical protein
MRLPLPARASQPPAIRRLLGGVVIFAAALGASRAAAGDELFALSWVRGQGAEGCAAAPALRAEIERRLGRKAFHDDADRSFEVLVQGSGDEFRALIYIRTADGRVLGNRLLTSTEASCASLFHATALAIALAIDPDARADAHPIGVASFGEPDEPEGPQERIAVPEPPPAPPPARPVVLAAPEQSRPREGRQQSGTVRATGGAALGIGLLPAPAPGYGITASGEPTESWGWEAGMVHLPGARHRSEGVEALVGLDAAWLAGQYLPITTDAASVAVGLGASAGALQVAVRSPDPLDVGDFLHVALRGGALLDVRLGGPFVAELGASAWLPLTRHRLNVVRGDRSGLVWEMPPAGVLGTLGFGAVAP